jgi:hypothetical protein
MKKINLNKISIFVVASLIFFLVVLFVFYSPTKYTLTGRVIEEEGRVIGENEEIIKKSSIYDESVLTKEINLIFYDNKTNCKLNGEIYVDDFFLGESKEGIFTLTEEVYNQKFNQDSLIYIFGRTDFCFGTEDNLPFVDYWTINNLQQSLDNEEESVFFESNLDPRWPSYYWEKQNFIRPEEVREYLEENLRKSLKNNTWEDIDKIVDSMKISYISDWNQFQKSEYWQIPAEVLRARAGDCEDWAVTTLSLIRAYNDSVKCYNVLWPTHVSIFCYENNRFVIYDQDKTKFTTVLTKNSDEFVVQQENKIALRKMRNDYFNWYGLSPNQRKMDAIFNEKELIIFEEDEDFIKWAIEIINEKN